MANVILKKQLLNLFKNKLIVDSIWALLGNIIFKGLSLFAGIIVARILGKDIFGEFSIIKSTFISLGLFVSFGLGYTATKFVADYKDKYPEQLRGIFHFIQKSVIIFSSLICCIVLVFAKKIAVDILENEALGQYLALVSILVILNSLNLLYIGFLAGLGLFKKMAKVNTFIGFFAFTTSVAFTYYLGLKGALLALVFVQGMNVIINYRLIRKQIRNVKQIKNKKTNKKILTYSLPIAIQEAVYAVMSWLISFLIIYFSSFGELGMYIAAIQLNAVILFIPGILRNVVLSHLSEVQNDNKKHRSILNTILIINFLATLVPCAIIFMFNDYVASLYGESFSGLGNLIRISIFTTIFVSISNVYAQAYMSKNLNWTMLSFRIIRDIGTIILFVILINQNIMGARSMIISNLILGVVFMFIMISYYKHKVNKL